MLARLPTSIWLRDRRRRPSRAIDAKVLAGFAEALPFIENFRFVPRAAARAGTRRPRPAGARPAPAAAPAGARSPRRGSGRLRSAGDPPRRPSFGAAAAL